MSDFGKVWGFEDERAPPRRPVYLKDSVLAPARPTGRGPVARLARVASGAPEAILILNGRPNDVRALDAHLRYITRDSALELEDQDGIRLTGPSALGELARDWGAAARASDLSHPHAALACCMVLSAPRGSPPALVAAAGRALARETFAERFDYVFALHTDTSHPHMHLTVRSLGRDRRRLNPSAHDGFAWRTAFAEALCARGIEAVASLCSERGVTPRREPIGLRKLRERHAEGRGEVAAVDRTAMRAAAGLAFLGQTDPTKREQRLVERQAEVRAAWLAEAERRRASSDPADRALAEQIQAFVAEMPEPLTRRQKLARQLLAINQALARDSREPEAPNRDMERSR